MRGVQSSTPPLPPGLLKESATLLWFFQQNFHTNTNDGKNDEKDKKPCFLQLNEISKKNLAFDLFAEPVVGFCLESSRTLCVSLRHTV